MTIQPILGYLQVFFDYIQRPLMQSVVKKKCLKSEPPIQDIATLGNGQHKLDLDSHPHSEALFLGYEYDFSRMRLNLFKLSLQLRTSNHFEVDLVKSAFNWLGLLIGSTCIDFRLDRILLGTFGEAPVNVTSGIS